MYTSDVMYSPVVGICALLSGLRRAIETLHPPSVQNSRLFDQKFVWCCQVPTHSATCFPALLAVIRDDDHFRRYIVEDSSRRTLAASSEAVSLDRRKKASPEALRKSF